MCVRLGYVRLGVVLNICAFIWILDEFASKWEKKKQNVVTNLTDCITHYTCTLSEASSVTHQIFSFDWNKSVCVSFFYLFLFYECSFVKIHVNICFPLCCSFTLLATNAKAISNDLIVNRNATNFANKRTRMQ